jgi:hypothetical protein
MPRHATSRPLLLTHEDELEMHATVLDGDRRPPLSGVVSVEQIPGRVRSLCDERGAWPAHTATGLLGPAHFVPIVPPTF